MAYLRSFFASAALVMALSPYCWAVSVPGDYDTIQAAITALETDAASGDTIEVARGVYRENIVLSGAITIVGDETAATFLEADNESEAILSISNASNVVVRNVTFRNGNLGIALTNSSAVIASNVFRLGDNGDAIDSDGLSDVDIVNNTFYDNDTAVERGNEATEIRNNIFDNNNIAISPSTLTGAVSDNCFDGNGDDGVVGTQAVTSGDPLFVSSSLGDFHLKEGSPCIDAGSGTDVIDSTNADMGAYGGSYADVFPFKVQNVFVNDASANVGTPSISVSWSSNQSYRVTHTINPGGYKLYYDSDQPGSPYGGTDASSGTQPSPIDVGNVTSYTISDLTPPSINPATPAISNITPSNQALDISWAAVASATGYRLYYGVNDPGENQLNVGNATNYRLSGLTNGVTYSVAVSALHQATYYLSVTAYDNTANPSHESDYSIERSLAMGDEREGALSATVTGIPEIVVPFPQLPDEGCFIATAAFGYYDAPQVQLLRDFRDRYLLSHSPGRWFVKQYYTHGPEVARYIERHPGWKSVVRVALLPLIVMAWVLFKASWFVQIVIAVGGLLIMLGGVYLWRSTQTTVSIKHPRKVFS